MIAYFLAFFRKSIVVDGQAEQLIIKKGWIFKFFVEKIPFSFIGSVSLVDVMDSEAICYDLQLLSSTNLNALNLPSSKNKINLWRSKNLADCKELGLFLV
jgi:hypothetical protein